MKNILISDIDSHLGNELTRLYLNQGDNVIGTVSNKDILSNFDHYKNKPFSVIYWNRSSSLSAKDIIIKARSKLKKIDIIFILKPPTKKEITITDCSIVDIENLIDAGLKGTIFFVKEALRLFNKQNKLLIILVNIYSEKPQETNFIESIISSGFQGLASFLCASLKLKGLFIHSFYTTYSTDVFKYANFILKTIKTKVFNKSGNIFRYNSRFGF